MASESEVILKMASLTYGMSQANCTSSPGLQANPDISGIGVIVGFMATAYLTLICCIAKTIIDYLVQKANSKNDVGPTSTRLPGPPGQKVSKDKGRLERWSFALESMITSFSDQQVVTGIAILIGGFSQLGWGIALYHWLNVVNLAWFSAMTHLLTLTTMRKQIRGSKAVRILRIVGMGILVIILIVALVPVGYILSGDLYFSGFPAWCIFHPHLTWKTNYATSRTGVDGSYSFAYVILAIAILLLSYITRMRLLFSDGSLRDFFRIPHLKLADRIERRLEFLQQEYENRWRAKVEYKIIHSLFIVTISATELYKTDLWEMTWLLFALSWGTARIIVDLDHNNGIWVSNIPSSIMAEQHMWGFGQVVAIGLLFLPLLSFFDAYVSGNGSKTTPKTKVHDPDPTAHTIQQPKTKRTITTNPWFTKLQILWYLYTFAIGLELIDKIPLATGVTSGSPTSNLTLEAGFLVPPAVEAFLSWLALDLGLLWLSALIFADSDVQRWWLHTQLGEWTAEKKKSVVRYVLEAGIVSIWVIGSLFFWWWGWYLSIDRIYKFLDPMRGNGTP